MVSIEGAAEAGKLAFRQIRPTLLRCPNNHKIINNAVEIIRGFVWILDLVAAVGSGSISDFMHLIKADRIAKGEIELFRKLLSGAFFEDTPVLPQH